jgi:hypothetical protein
MSSVNARRSGETPPLHGAGRILHAIGATLLACLRFPAAVFEWLFRVGYTIFVKAPIAMAGLLFILCACLVLFGFGQKIYEYNHNPTEQLQSARNALVVARKLDHDIADQRRVKGLQPLPADQLFAPPLETKVARLQAKIAARDRPKDGAR